MFNLRRRSGATVLPTSGNVGAQYTVAAGWAQAIACRLQGPERAEWDGAIAVAMGGDGSTASIGFWAALNIATTLTLPMLFFIEDNGYAISVPATLQTPGGNIAANLASFGNLTVLDVDGSDPQEAGAAVGSAVRAVRDGRGPYLVRMRVPRLRGHAYHDDQAYKNAEDRQREASRDPLPRLRDHLESQGVSREEMDAIAHHVREKLTHSLVAAQAMPEPDPARLAWHMFSDTAKRSIESAPVTPDPSYPLMIALSLNSRYQRNNAQGNSIASDGY